MSKLLVYNLAEHGHLNATFPLVAELVARGHQVLYYSTEPFCTKIEATGAIYRSYGNPSNFQPPAHQGGLYSVMAYHMELASQIIPGLLEELKAELPDFLLIDSMCVWGNLIQQITSVPAITLGSVFLTHDRLITPDKMVDMAYAQASPQVVLEGIAALNRYFELSQQLDHRYGTRSPNIVEFFCNRQPLNILFTSRKFHLMGGQFDESYRFVGPSIASRTEQANFPFHEIKSGPLIYISLGTIYNDWPEFYRACFEAFAHTPYRVVLASGDGSAAQGLGNPPANFIVRPSVPQLEILQRADLFITHGGMNSASEALYFGVPLIVLPQHGDQYLVASRTKELGAGLTLHRSEATAENLKQTAARVLSDSRFKTSAMEIAESFKMAGGCKRGADEIEAFIKAPLVPEKNE
jgi:MGT family glycosyltransferase